MVFCIGSFFVLAFAAALLYQVWLSQVDDIYIVSPDSSDGHETGGFFYTWAEQPPSEEQPIHLLAFNHTKQHPLRLVLHKQAFNSYCGFGFVISPQTLAEGDRILLDIKAKEPFQLDLSLVESAELQESPPEDWRGHANYTRVNQWQTLSIPLAKLQINPFYQPQGKEGDGVLNVQAVDNLCFVFAPGKALDLEFGPLYIVRDKDTWPLLGFGTVLLGWYFLLWQWGRSIERKDKHYLILVSDVFKYVIFCIVAFWVLYAQNANDGLHQRELRVLIVLFALGIGESIFHWRSPSDSRWSQVFSFLSPWLLVGIAWGMDGFFPLLFLLCAASMYHGMVKQGTFGLWFGLLSLILIAFLIQYGTGEFYFVDLLLGFGLLLAFDLMLDSTVGYRNWVLVDELQKNNVSLTEERNQLTRNLQAFIENMMEGYILLEIHGDASPPFDFGVLEINPLAERMVQMERRQILGQSLFQVFPALQNEEVLDVLSKVALQRNAARIDTLNLRVGQDPRCFTLVVYPVGNAVAMIFQDITETVRMQKQRRRMEIQLHREQKLASLGRMAGGLAHEYNNLLTGIMGYASLAMAKMDPSHSLWKPLSVIEESAQRAAKLTRKLLAFSGKGRFFVEKIDLELFVTHFKSRFQETYGDRIEFEYALTSNLPVLEADSREFRFLLKNLVENAVEAIPDRGVVWIRTGMVFADAAYLESCCEETPAHEGHYVYLEIEDNGVGMEKSVLEKLFDPFFSTKFIGRGMGMAAVLGIVRGHGGTIQVISKVGEGTMVRILFPVAPSLPSEPVDQAV